MIILKIFELIFNFIFKNKYANEWSFLSSSKGNEIGGIKEIEIVISILFGAIKYKEKIESGMTIPILNLKKKEEKRFYLHGHDDMH